GGTRLVKILARVQDGTLQEAVAEAAPQLSAELLTVSGGNGRSSEQQLVDGLRSHPAVVIVEAAATVSLRRLREETRARGVALVVVCASSDEVRDAVEVRVDEWMMLPVTANELVGRIQGALRRTRESEAPELTSRAAEHLRYEEL